MAGATTRDRLQRLRHDRNMLSKMLKDYRTQVMPHLDEREHASVLESIQRRIADIDERMKTLDHK